MESLTNPVSKAASVDQSSKSKEKVTTTPLIQYLKEKKANKGKESAAAAVKGAKHARQGSKDSPPNATPSSDKSSPAKAVPSTASVPDKRSAQAIMVEKAARDAARIVNKQAPIASRKTWLYAVMASPLAKEVMVRNLVGTNRPRGQTI